MIHTDSILFNPLKHYLPHIRSFIQSSIIEFDSSKIKNELKMIGESQMDLYIGPLSIETIYNETLEFLKSNNIQDYTSFLDWIKQQDDFISYKLPDQSLWVIRLGTNGNNFIHIHPGRHSANTMRVKAGVLKTSIATIVTSQVFKKDITLELVNESRVNLLDLPPIKELKENEGIKKMIDIIYKSTNR